MQDPDAWTSIREAGNNDDDEDLLGDVDAFAAINYPSVDTEEKFTAQLEKAANEKLFPAELPQEQRQQALNARVRVDAIVIATGALRFHVVLGVAPDMI